MTKRHQTQVKFTSEEIILLLDSLELKGSQTIVKDESREAYETWQRVRQRLNRALDRIDDVYEDVRD